jgi:hypothetical protein
MTLDGITTELTEDQKTTFQGVTSKHVLTYFGQLRNDLPDISFIEVNRVVTAITSQVFVPSSIGLQKSNSSNDNNFDDGDDDDDGDEKDKEVDNEDGRRQIQGLPPSLENSTQDFSGSTSIEPHWLKIEYRQEITYGLVHPVTDFQEEDLFLDPFSFDAQRYLIELILELQFDQLIQLQGTVEVGAAPTESPTAPPTDAPNLRKPKGSVIGISIGIVVLAIVVVYYILRDTYKQEAIFRREMAAARRGMAGDSVGANSTSGHGGGSSSPMHRNDSHQVTWRRRGGAGDEAETVETGANDDDDEVIVDFEPIKPLVAAAATTENINYNNDYMSNIIKTKVWPPMVIGGSQQPLPIAEEEEMTEEGDEDIKSQGQHALPLSLSHEPPYQDTSDNEMDQGALFPLGPSPLAMYFTELDDYGTMEGPPRGPPQW